MIISSALLFVYFLQGRAAANPQEISFDQMLTRVRNKEASELNIKQSQIELVDKNQTKFFTSLDSSDATRKIILDAADRNRNKS